MVTITFSVTDDLVPAGALEGVQVRIYSADGTTFITAGTTDSAGQYSTDLTDLTAYWVRFYLPGYAFPSKMIFTANSGLPSNTWDIVGNDIVARPPSIDPNLCRATGQVVGAAGQPVDGITFRFMMTEEPRVVGGRVVIPNNVIVRTSQLGFIQIDLIRNGIYEVGIEGIPGLELSGYSVPRFRVPDAASCNFVEMIWSYVSAVTLSTLVASVAVDADVTVTVSAVTLSSGLTVPYDLDCDEEVTRASLLLLESSDTDIATATWSESHETIVITGVAAGSATISVKQAPLTYLPRQPALSETIATITVTVT